jgi:murein DD-endopeptidase MepM/ murein hydrolase activator NlpD
LKTYYYDKDEIQFKPVDNNPWQKVIHNACIWIIGSVILLGFAIGIAYQTGNTPAIIALRSKNKILRKHLKHTQLSLNEFKGQLKKLATDDNKLYRTVLGMKAISPGERQAGTGGAAIYAKYDIYGVKTAAILKRTARKLKKTERSIKIQQTSFNEIKKQYNLHRKRLNHIPAIKPVKGYISSGFGMRYHPILHYRRMHTGIDIAAPDGASVYATADGVVKQAGPDGSYGNLIIIDNGFGYETYFAHLSAIAKGIEPGASVKRGEKIGYVGQTGLTTGPHLHYEIRINGNPVNPIGYFYANTTPSQFLKYKKEAEESTRSMD